MKSVLTTAAFVLLTACSEVLPDRDDPTDVASAAATQQAAEAKATALKAVEAAAAAAAAVEPTAEQEVSVEPLVEADPAPEEVHQEPEAPRDKWDELYSKPIPEQRRKAIYLELAAAEDKVIDKVDAMYPNPSDGEAWSAALDRESAAVRRRIASKHGISVKDTNFLMLESADKGWTY